MANPDQRSSTPPSRNRLASETSPYLLQHQHNPVDWYPWGPEALERARREDKPIFLSVGYSTCYWCHVMERQCFEIEAVAAVMNEKFVNIKVDREERPDVDQLYMTAVQVLTRHGGWPMSVWLTSDLRPFYGGTYFPPADQAGRPGFVTLLHALEDAYRTRPADVNQTAGQLLNVLQRVAEPPAPDKPLRIDDAFVAEIIEGSTSDYDPTNGGFGGAPKFPRETLLELLLVSLDVGDERATATGVSATGQIATGQMATGQIATGQIATGQTATRDENECEPAFGADDRAASAGSALRCETASGDATGVQAAAGSGSVGGAGSGNGGDASAEPRRGADPRAGAATRELSGGGETSRLRDQVLHTLDALAAGGIRDHLGGGFHRYSTDAEWLVPHFEIMLYDNALLAWCYAEAHRQTGRPGYARVAQGIFDFVLREMTSPDGAFYTALDAEVDGQEGLNYLWTPAEVETLLGVEDATLFGRVYGLSAGPNFADPHHGSGVPHQNILYLPESLDAAARALGISADDLDRRLAPMRATLKAARDRRKQPLLDTKILTSWNALMIRALAHGGRVLGRPDYLAAARRATEFLLLHHRTPTGGLYRTSRDGRAQFDGFLDDYAYLAQAMLALDAAGIEAGMGSAWRDRACEIAALMADRFGKAEGRTATPASPGTGVSVAGRSVSTESDSSEVIATRTAGGIESGARAGTADESAEDFPGGDMHTHVGVGGFFFTDRHSADLLVRQKTATDSPLPSGNAVAAMVLLSLGQVDAARNVVAAFAQQVQHNGEGMSAIVQAALLLLRKRGEPFTVAPWPRAGEASGRPASPAQIAREIVVVRTRWSSPSELRLRLTIRPGFHLNADVPGGPDELRLVPTRLVVDGYPAREVKVTFPQGEQKSLSFATAPVRVYEGEVEISLTFVAPVRMRLHLNLTYQACDDRACLPPTTQRIEVAAP